MIEVPAAVLNAPELLTEVDFVSVGTNDLTQYVFAADRRGTWRRRGPRCATSWAEPGSRLPTVEDGTRASTPG
jgi:PEP-utilizing family enzyme